MLPHHAVLLAGLESQPVGGQPWSQTGHTVCLVQGLTVQRVRETQ